MGSTLDRDYLGTIRTQLQRIAPPRVRLLSFVDRGQMYILDPEVTGRQKILILHPKMRPYVRRLGLTIEHDDTPPRHVRRRRNKARAIARHNARRAAR